jgi:hypothetical protein
MTALKADSSLSTLQITVNNFAVPAEETTYMEFCFNAQTLLSLPDANSPVHVVGFEAVIKPETKKYIHHYTLYGANNACTADSVPSNLGGIPKGPMVWAWGE